MVRSARVAGVQMLELHPLVDGDLDATLDVSGSRSRAPVERLVRGRPRRGSGGRRRRHVGGHRGARTSSARRRSGTGRDGVIAGLPVAAAVIEMVCGPIGERVRACSSPTATLVEPGTEIARVDRADAAPAHRRAHGAQPAVPPLRRRHADPTLGRRARGNRRQGARHPQDDAGSAGRSRSTPCAAAAASTTAWGSTTWRS